MDLKLNFAWSKKAKDNEKIVGDKNILTNKKRIDVSEDQPDFVTSIEKNTITSTKPQQKEEEIIIPLVQSKYQPLKIKTKLPTTNAEDLDIKDELKKEAMKKIIAEAKEENEKGNDDNLVIPIVESTPGEREVENPEEIEEEIQDADYEAVPVSKFGLAALRGMGSKAEIDARLPMAAPMPVRRSKGLGLGAVLEKDDRKTERSKDKDEDEELAFKRGTRCRVTGGRMSGRYGTIDSVDGNTDRVIVALAAAGSHSVVTVPSVMVQLVSEKEFKKYSKYLNRESADAFKSKEEERMEREREKDRAWREEERRREKREKEKEREREREKEKEREREREKKRKRDREAERANSAKKSKSFSASSWVRPRLRVRLVDKNYREGRYFKEKLVVMDVPSPSICVCQTENQRILDDVSSKMLETVIPRGDHAPVMVLRGEFADELAEIVQRNKERCQAVVQMTNDKSLQVLDYDDLCEFVG